MIPPAAVRAAIIIVFKRLSILSRRPFTSTRSPPTSESISRRKSAYLGVHIPPQPNYGLVSRIQAAVHFPQPLVNLFIGPL